MNFFFLIICFFVFSCAYPDIDSVPDFNNVNLTEEELIDLCTNKSSDTNISKTCEDFNKLK